MKKSFDKFKCDKGSLRHRYDRLYEPVLKKYLETEFRMLEVGIFKGNSMEAWLDYFPMVQLIGVDVFTRINEKNIPVLNHGRVQWCKQNSMTQLSEEFLDLAQDKFDVIIDDGLHTHDSQRLTFENLIPFLKDDGVYFIEDVWAFDHMSEADRKHSWLQKKKDKYSDKQYNVLLLALSGYSVKFHDLRNGYEPDTFIIEIRK